MNLIHVMAIVVVLAHAGVFLVPAASGAGFLLILIFPGMVLSELLFKKTETVLSRVFLAGACGALAALFLLFFVHLVPGAMPRAHLWLLLDVLTMSGLFVLWHADENPPFTFGGIKTWWAPLLILCLAMSVRLYALGSAEFQGDETRAVIMASDAVHGMDDILNYHKKGPAEVLFPAGQLALATKLTEFSARLPFAFLGIVLLLGAYALAREVFKKSSFESAVVILFLAFDGFLIAFSRIVQYQNVVSCFGICSVYLAFRYKDDGKADLRYPALSLFFLAGAFFGHFDAVFYLPVVGWILVTGLWERRAFHPRTLAYIGILPAVFMGIFFVPFFRHEHFARTAQYLSSRTGQGEGIRFFGNLRTYFELSTFYSTTYQIKFFILLLFLAAFGRLFLSKKLRPVRRTFALWLFLAGMVGYFNPEMFSAPDAVPPLFVISFFCIAFLVTDISLPLSERALFLWFGVPFVAEAFFVARPYTHFYNMHIPAAFLCASTLDGIKQRFRQFCGLEGSVIFSGGLAALFGAALWYVSIVYLDQGKEYQLTFPKHRPSFFAASYRGKLPRGGYFGFPHRAGWKVIGALYERGILHGSYDSNEEELVTAWYVPGQVRCAQNPDYYFILRRPRDPVSVPKREIEARYHEFARVQVDGETMMLVYSREPAATTQVFELEDFRREFDEFLVPVFPLTHAESEFGVRCEPSTN